MSNIPGNNGTQIPSGDFTRRHIIHIIGHVADGYITFSTDGSIFNIIGDKRIAALEVLNNAISLATPGFGFFSKIFLIGPFYFNFTDGIVVRHASGCKSSNQDVNDILDEIKRLIETKAFL